MQTQSAMFMGTIKNIPFSPPDISESEIAATLEMLHEASDQNDDAAAKRALKKAVPTFSGEEMTA